MQDPDYKKILWLIVIVSLLKLITASLLELGNDEVYYWTYAIQPDWSHFDHPPMVGWLIRLSTLNLLWVNEISVRLGSILCAAISTIFIFKTGKLIVNEKVGWYAALIYNCSVYTSILAGLFILPDSPQMPFWTGALYLMAHLIAKDQEKKVSTWLWLGLLIGLASLCKIHALFLWAGFGLFLMINRIKWLFNWRFYVSVSVTLVCLIPILYWNVRNNFITYRYHSERVTHSSIQWDMLGKEILGEFVYQNPIVFVLLVISLVALIKGKLKLQQKWVSTWLLCLSLPMIALFWGVSLFNPTLPHWSGPGFIPLFFIGAIYLDKKPNELLPSFIKIAGSFLLFVLVTGTFLIRYSPVNFGSHERENFGEYCPTLDLSGWKDFSNAFSVIVKEDERNGVMMKNAPLLINKWFPGGHLEFYTSRLTGLPVLGIGALEDIHKFAWLNKDRKQLQLGDDAYCIVPSNLPTDVNANYGSYFTSIEKYAVLNQIRSGSVVRYFTVYRLHGCKRIPIILLP